MSTFGKLDEYNESEDWRHYIERVNHFLKANKITDPDKKRSIFLVSVGDKTFKVIRSLAALDDPKSKTGETCTRSFYAKAIRYCAVIQSRLTLAPNNQLKLLQYF